jgi:hypothetical protein
MPRLTLLNQISEYLARRRERRALVETARIVEGLPFHIRKDIGWPDSYNPAHKAARL